MATHFHNLKVKEVIKETPNCVSISFDIPEDLKEIFTFKEGQNITIKKNINGEEVRRSYSICNAPFENELKVAIKKVNAGIFSTYANEELKAGDELEIMPPVGKFGIKKPSGNFIAIAAGSGITPILSIIKHTLKTHTDSSFTLVYGNQSRRSIMFFEEIESLKNKYIQRFNTVHILSRERTDATLNYGRIDNEKLVELKKQLQFKKFTEAVICGPEQMIFSTAAFLENEGIAKADIHFELFTSSSKNKEVVKKIISETDDAPKSNITIKLDGRSFEFKLGYNAENILDAALAQGADLPYACKGGVCCTCKAKLIQGKVSMDVNYALEEEEVAEGYILTCQSHPLTENIVVDFDVK